MSPLALSPFWPAEFPNRPPRAGEARAGTAQRVTYPSERDARQIAFQVLGETSAVGGMMQHGIDVMKYIRRRDAVVIVENLE